NLGLCLMEKKQFQRAIQTMQKAAEAGDSPELAQNLVTAIELAPPALQRSASLKPVVESAHLLASKYGVSSGGTFMIIPLHEKPGKSDESFDDGPIARMWSGTGFMV